MILAPLVIFHECCEHKLLKQWHELRLQSTFTLHAWKFIIRTCLMVTTFLLLLVLSALHLNSGGFNQRDTFSSLFEHYSFTSQSQPVTCRKVCAQLFLTFDINHLSIWGWTCAVNHWGTLWILTKWITLSFFVFFFSFIYISWRLITL